MRKKEIRLDVTKRTPRLGRGLLREGSECIEKVEGLLSGFGEAGVGSIEKS